MNIVSVPLIKSAQYQFNFVNVYKLSCFYYSHLTNYKMLIMCYNSSTTMMYYMCLIDVCVI